MYKKEYIYETAMELFSKYGLQKVNVQEIADSAGISKKTIYNHFENKNELFFRAVHWDTMYIVNSIEKIVSDSRILPMEKLYELMNIVNNKLVSTNSVLIPDMRRVNPYLNAKPIDFVQSHVHKNVMSLFDQAKNLGLCRTDISTDKIAYFVYTLLRGIQTWRLDENEMTISIGDLFKVSALLCLESLLTPEGLKQFPWDKIQ